MEEITWKVFASTGKVEDYLYYRGENRKSVLENKKDGGGSLDRTREEAVWEEPLR